MARIDIGAGQTPTSGNDLVFGTAGNDTITDPGGNDLTFAGAGHDRITPGTGLDGVDGGAGTDTVVLSGNSGDYRIGSGTRNGITGVLVDDLRRGAANTDGLDAYVRVERLEFADGVRLLVPDQAPDAVDDAAQTDEGTVMTFNVLANDTDPDGDALSIASLSDADATKPGNQTALGATISVVDGRVRYDPSASDTLRALNTGQSAADSFTYTVSDGAGGQDTAGVRVAVNGLSQNQPPDAVDDSATTIEGAPIPIAVLRNDTDPDGSALVILALSDADAARSGFQTALGATVSVEAGQVRYDPTNSAALQALNTGERAADSFTYTVSDGSGGQDTAVVRVTVNGMTLPPDAVDDSAATAARAATFIPVLDNDTDSDGDPLAIFTLSDADPARGGFQTALGATVSVVDRQVLYEPASSASLQALLLGERATDSFTYTVSDGFGLDAAEVRVTVSGVNRVPIARSDTAQTPAFAPLHFIPVLANDTDPDGDLLTILALTDADPARDGFQTALGATVSIGGFGVLYDPTGSAVLRTLLAGTTLDDSFLYTVSDGFGGQATAPVIVSVLGESILF